VSLTRVPVAETLIAPDTLTIEKAAVRHPNGRREMAEIALELSLEDPAKSHRRDA
jgi:hypothetical protein